MSKTKGGCNQNNKINNYVHCLIFKLYYKITFDWQNAEFSRITLNICTMPSNNKISLRFNAT